MYLTSLSISYPPKREPSFTIIEILNGQVEHFNMASYGTRSIVTVYNFKDKFGIF